MTLSKTILFVCSLMLAADLSAARQPNVVLLLSDDLGWKDLGCYGGPVKTPTLDGLAAQGVRFTDFHSGAAVCSTSRATLLTGRQYIRAGIYGVLQDSIHNEHLLEREVTIAELLKGHGYATAHFGKWHLGMTSGSRKKPTPAEHGFDHWFATVNGAGPSQHNPSNFIRNGRRVGPLSGYACQLLVDEAIQWLDEKRKPDQPFFLNVWFHEPHAPLAAPDELVSHYGDLKDPAALYSGTIENTDRAIARLLKKLAQVDAPENTLIIYSSDNGSYRADRVGNLRGIKGSNYEGGIRVPGIFHWPGHVIPGRVEAEPAGLVDVLPTICGLAGIAKPSGVHLDGADLSPVLLGRGKAFKRLQPLIWISPDSAPAIAIRDGRWSLVAKRAYEFPKDVEKLATMAKEIETLLRKKGIFEEETRGSTLLKQMFEGFKDREADELRGQYVLMNTFRESWIPVIKAGGYSRFELYDLENDPAQKTDLSVRHPGVVDRLKAKLLEINASVMADGPEWVPPGDIAAAANWHQWRGPENNGVSRTAKPPLRWSETENVQWKVAIQGSGSSSPIIWGDKVFVLTAVNTGIVDSSLPRPEDQPKRVFDITHPNTSYQFLVLCLDRKTGKEVWRRKATEMIPHEGHHKDNNFASASPVTDGQRLWCWFGSAGLFCYDLDGNPQWKRNLGKANMGASLGEGTSPVLHDGKLVIVRDHQGQSSIEVLDAMTGKTVWRKERDEGNTWATPAIAKHSGRTQVITPGSNRIRSYDLATGEVIWQCGGLTGNAIPCPVIDGDVVYCMTGYQGHAVLAVPLSAKGDITGSDQIHWKLDRGTPYIPSPLLYDGLLFFNQSNQSMWTWVNAKNGEVHMDRERLPGIFNIYASPVGADGRIYVTARNGTTLVLKRERKLNVLATNVLDDAINASAALAGNQLFLRGQRFLYCLSESPASLTERRFTPLPRTGSQPKSNTAGPNKLFAQIEDTQLPQGYTPWLGKGPGDYGRIHQAYVDKRMAGLNDKQRGRIGQLWKQRRELQPQMKNAGASFVKIMEWVANNEK